MAEMKSDASRCVVIGDLVASRRSADRRSLQQALNAALADVDETCPSVSGLRVTVGDEFQGSYRSLGDALEVALRVRIRLLPEGDVRVGIGRGPVTVLDAERGIEDGPGWWAARAALVAVEEAAERSPTRLLRTGVRTAAGVGADAVEDPGADETGLGAAVNAALLCRDHLVGSLSQRSLRLLEGLMHPDTTQAALAEREGVSASAVSQRVRIDGIGAVLAAQALLRDLP